MLAPDRRDLGVRGRHVLAIAGQQLYDQNRGRYECGCRDHWLSVDYESDYRADYHYGYLPGSCGQRRCDNLVRGPDEAHLMPFSVCGSVRSGG